MTEDTVIVERDDTDDMETTATLHASEPGRHWMRLLKEHSLRDFLALREAPFKDLD